jgi:hypothetical protein
MTASIFPATLHKSISPSPKWRLSCISMTPLSILSYPRTNLTEIAVLGCLIAAYVLYKLFGNVNFVFQFLQCIDQSCIFPGSTLTNLHGSAVGRTNSGLCFEAKKRFLKDISWYHCLACIWLIKVPQKPIQNEVIRSRICRCCRSRTH